MDQGCPGRLVSCERGKNHGKDGFAVPWHGGYNFNSSPQTKAEPGIALEARIGQSWRDPSTVYLAANPSTSNILASSLNMQFSARPWSTGQVHP